jgi:hypothetical protein
MPVKIFILVVVFFALSVDPRILGRAKRRSVFRLIRIKRVWQPRMTTPEKITYIFVWEPKPMLENVRYRWLHGCLEIFNKIPLQEIFVISKLRGMRNNIKNSKIVFQVEIVLCRDWNLSQCAAPYAFSEIFICRQGVLYWLTQEILNRKEKYIF